MSDSESGGICVLFVYTSNVFTMRKVPTANLKEPSAFSFFRAGPLYRAFKEQGACDTHKAARTGTGATLGLSLAASVEYFIWALPRGCLFKLLSYL